MTDTRYVYGARCTWHGPISAVGHRTSPASSKVLTIPACPHCNGMLFEYPNKETWDNGVAQFDAKHPGYKEFTEWLGSYGRCWPNPVIAAVHYKTVTGKDVQLGT